MQRRTVVLSGLAAALAGCGSPNLYSYTGPEVTRVVVQKTQRRMFLLNDSTILRAYDIDLGFAPTGHKQAEGDGRTPEGAYRINRKNPDSLFHLSLGISYPNAADVAKAEELGVEPGGDIFVHGARRPMDRKGRDWTWGCISVENAEIEEIYAMVQTGTQIDIHP